MAKQTVLEEVKTRMAGMLTSKAEQLETIRRKQAEARTQIEAAGLAMKRATEEMDVDAYGTAKANKQKAQTALDMYTGRYDQIRKQEFITEPESDSVINSLLDYEKKLAEDFRAAVAAPLKQLADLLTVYRAEVEDTEKTLDAWQTDIRANYSTRGRTWRKDPVTGEYTDRNEAPVPVHVMPYTGCSEAAQLGDYLKKAAPLMGKESR